MNVLSLSGRRSDAGFSLIVSLIMLIVIIVLGISASQMSVNEERGARNNRDRQMAFQAAEAALKDGEAEIFGSVAGCPPRTATPPATGTVFGGGRLGTTPLVCFTEQSGVGFASSGSLYACGTSTFVGLCDSTATPAYLSATVDFYKDALGTGNMSTVGYGQISGKTFPAQFTTTGTATALRNQPVSAYPPRYIIERVFKNVAQGDVQGKYMFRITAMGFGANPNAQVVLQSIVSTEN